MKKNEKKNLKFKEKDIKNMIFIKSLYLNII